MTLHGNFALIEPSHRDEARDFVRLLYRAMFSMGAKYTTTHALARYYAAGIVTVILKDCPNYLSESAKKLTLPPFSGHGIRRWYRRADVDRELYRDGDMPIGFDFERYVLAGLLPERTGGDPTYPGLEQIKERILWRIHRLGYSLKKFGQIDREICEVGVSLESFKGSWAAKRSIWQEVQLDSLP